MKKVISLLFILGLCNGWVYGQEFMMKPSIAASVLDRSSYVMQSIPPPYQLFTNVAGVATAVTSTASTNLGGGGSVPLPILAKCVNAGAIVDCSFSGGPGSATYGTYASLSGTCTTGAQYLTSDSPYTFMCTATNTQTAFLKGTKVTLPPTCGSMTSLGSGFTSGTCTNSGTPGALALEVTGVSGCCNIFAQVQSAPATPYTYTTFLQTVNSIGSSTNVNAGVIFRDSATGKSTAFGLYNGGWRIEYWTNIPASGTATDSSTLTSGLFPTNITWNGLMGYRISDDGTNRLYYVCFASATCINPLDWKLIYSEARTTNFTANQVGFDFLVWNTQSGVATFYDWTQN